MHYLFSGELYFKNQSLKVYAALLPQLLSVFKNPLLQVEVFKVVKNQALEIYYGNKNHESLRKDSFQILIDSYTFIIRIVEF